MRNPMQLITGKDANSQQVENKEVSKEGSLDSHSGEWLEMELECEHEFENQSLHNLSLTMNFSFGDAA